MHELEKRITSPQHRFLVFTSAGQWANSQQWLEHNRQWDLWVCNYSHQRHSLAAKADYYFERAGGKFPNLFFAYQHWPDIFKQYQAILVLDDDLVFTAGSINQLFEAHQKYQLWLLQPAFSPRGKISHRLTGVRSMRKLTYTNFVEVCAPLIQREKLEEFFAEYDPQLVGWGIDYWLAHRFRNERRKIAVIHDVVCINPEDNAKAGQREIESLQNQEQRKACWNAIKQKLQIEDLPLREYATVWLAPWPKHVIRGITIFLERKYLRHIGKKNNPRTPN